MSETKTVAERDLDLLLITGAGASREFGALGQRLPLMAEWSEALVSKLASGPSGYLDATNLTVGLDGYEFEQRLGVFLRGMEAFFRVGFIIEPSLKFQEPPHVSFKDPSVLHAWHDHTQEHLIRVQNLIHESLYEQFGDEAIDPYQAAEAYGWLLRALGIGKQQRWVLATTNYDTLAEQALTRLGFLPDAGQAPTFGGLTEARLDVERLIDGAGRNVPVLHLHGRVGWYRRPGDDATAYVTNVPKHNMGLGTPIVMLPDPDKVYDSQDVISALWAEFESALRRAKRVLVLGHSLNDQVLLHYIRTNVDPIDRLAVTVVADAKSPDQPDASAEPLIARIKGSFGNISIIPLSFGLQESGLEAIEKWLDRLERGGLAGRGSSTS